MVFVCIVTDSNAFCVVPDENKGQVPAHSVFCERFN